MSRPGALLPSPIMPGAAVTLHARTDKTAEAPQDKTASEEVTQKGEPVRSGCDLKEVQGARADCSTDGHTHALTTEDGQPISFLPNRYSDEHMEDRKYHNKTLEVYGVPYPGFQVLDAEAIKVGRNNMRWWGHCRTIDHGLFMKESEQFVTSSHRSGEPCVVTLASDNRDRRRSADRVRGPVTKEA